LPAGNRDVISIEESRAFVGNASQFELHGHSIKNAGAASQERIVSSNVNHA
jgi:hypothetical protein